MKLNPLQQSLLVLLIITLAVISISQMQQPSPQSETRIKTVKEGFSIHNRVYYGSGFRLSIPSGYTIHDASPTSLIIDPPGEGPNPYSDETGEGTNPMDDVRIGIIDKTMDSIFENEKQYIISWGDVIVAGRKGYKYVSGEGMAGHYDYLIELDDQRTLYLVSTASDEALDTIAALLEFE